MTREYKQWPRRLIIPVFLVLTLLFNVSPVMTTAKADSVGSTQVIVHYFRFAGDYANWNLWMWPSGGNGQSYDFTGSDGYGKVADAAIPGTPSQVGLIVRKGNWEQKDVDSDRYVNVTNEKAEVWLVQGNPTIFYSETAAENAAKPAAQNAFLDGAKQVLVKLSTPAHISSDGSDFSIVDQTTGLQIPITAASNASTAVLPDGTTDLVNLTLGQAPDVSHQLSLTWNGAEPIDVTPRNALDAAQYTYTGDDLGNTYTPSSTKFRVWAPTASSMQLLLYSSETGAAVTKTVDMNQSANGTWYADVPGDYKNWYYLYQVTIHGQTRTAVDPYATDVAPNATRAMIVDLADTNPAGWKADKHVAPDNPEDAVIYEAHVRDFSIDANSGMTHKGQYLAFTEQGTKGPNQVATGIDSLKQLGVTDVQVQPVQEFNSLDETSTQPQYNWGYDPRNYDVPEGAYATTPEGTARITEYKQMVQSLHKQGIGVIMDVVYNHTFATKVSDFDKLVPGYYYRTDNAGNYTNGSGVGNELATERPMVRKFVLDSTKFWVNEYHVDGFRFDLMALLGKDTVKAVSDELHQTDPGILLYGEPWTGGTSGMVGDTLLTKGQQQGLNVGVFNDNLRNALDGNVFDKSAQGFATGASGQVGAIENGVVGSIPYSGAIQDFTASPSETINYVTSHDNMTLWDKIAASNPADSQTDRIHMDELAQAVVFTSQGIPFMQGGEEMLRTKGGNDNSYNAGDAVNEFDWARKAQYPDVFNYYAGLIHLRLDHPAFRMTTADEIRGHLQFLSSPDNTVEYELTGNANGDHWKNIVVIYNPSKAAQTFNLPEGKWTIVASQDQAGENTLGHAEGTALVPAITCEVLYQTQDVK